MGLVFTGGTALAGLILVFLGGIFTAFDAYDATQQKSVRSKYRTRAYTALAGFVASLVAAILVIPAHWIAPACLLNAALIFLILAFGSTLAVAFMAVSDI